MPLDDYCSLYDPVVTGKGDGAITATPNVKRRILGNELKFRNLCPGG